MGVVWSYWDNIFLLILSRTFSGGFRFVFTRKSCAPAGTRTQECFSRTPDRVECVLRRFSNTCYADCGINVFCIGSLRQGNAMVYSIEIAAPARFEILRKMKFRDYFAWRDCFLGK